MRISYKNAVLVSILPFALSPATPPVPPPLPQVSHLILSFLIIAVMGVANVSSLSLLHAVKRLKGCGSLRMCLNGLWMALAYRIRQMTEDEEGGVS